MNTGWIGILFHQTEMFGADAHSEQRIRSFLKPPLVGHWFALPLQSNGRSVAVPSASTRSAVSENDVNVTMPKLLSESVWPVATQSGPTDSELVG